MKKDISDIRECLWHIEDSLITANHYLKEAKSMLRKIAEKNCRSLSGQISYWIKKEQTK